jgi:hypothetical protein
MHPVVCYDITYVAVYVTIVSTNVTRDKSILMYQHSFYCAKMFRYMFRPSRSHHQAYLQEFSLSFLIVF